MRGPSARFDAMASRSARDELELVPHVADGGHPGAEVDRRPLDLRDVRVHVPQAGHERLAATRRPSARPAGIGTDARGPTSAMRPSRTITTPSGIGGRAGAVDDRRADHRVGAALERRRRAA